MATTTTTSSAPTSVTTAVPLGAPVPPTSAAPGTAVPPDGSAKKKYGQQQQVPQTEAKLSNNELERVTEVFKMYETGLREATIYPKVS